MKGKSTTGRRRIEMLHDLANDDGYVALKRAAQDREGWRHRERTSERGIYIAEDYCMMMTTKMMIAAWEGGSTSMVLWVSAKRGLIVIYR